MLDAAKSPYPLTRRQTSASPFPDITSAALISLSFSILTLIFLWSYRQGYRQAVAKKKDFFFFPQHRSLASLGIPTLCRKSLSRLPFDVALFSLSFFLPCFSSTESETRLPSLRSEEIFIIPIEIYGQPPLGFEGPFPAQLPDVAQHSFIVPPFIILIFLLSH